MYDLFFLLYYAVFLLALMSYDWHIIYDNVFVGYFLLLLFYNLRSKASKFIPSAKPHEMNSDLDLFDYLFVIRCAVFGIGNVTQPFYADCHGMG